MSSDIPGHDGKDPPMAEQIAPDVAELHAAGHGRNEVARRLGVSTGTVSAAARIAGVEFDRSSTEVATRTRAVQLADHRADLAEMAADLATKAGRRLRIELDATILDPTTVRALGTTFGIAADKLAALSATVTDETSEHAAAEMWLEGLRLQIHAANEGLITPDENGNTPIDFGPPREDHE